MNSIDSGFILPSDVRWRDFLSRARHDVYHLPEYVSFCAEYEGGRPYAFYAKTSQSEFLAPLLIRQIPAELAQDTIGFDFTSPYGYSSPLWLGGEDQEDHERITAAFRQRAVERHIITGFFRLHPLLPLPVGMFDTGNVVEHGNTVAIDLSDPSEPPWSQFRSNHRRGIKRLIAKDYSVEIDDWSQFPKFVEIYRETMQRVGASKFYLFTDEYFTKLRDALGDRLHLATVYNPECQMACAGLFTTTNGIVQYHLGGTAPEFLSVAPTKLMFHEVQKWATIMGHCCFHLGGGVNGANDSLFNFKAGFSHWHPGFATQRIVFDRKRFDELNNRWRAWSQVEDSPNDFFPPYRNPVQPAIRHER